MTDPAPDPADVGRVVRLVGLREEPLDVAEVLAALEDDGGGGVALFVGRVRDVDHDRPVRALDYTAHPSALDRLREVCAGVAADHDVLAVAAVHRVGHLEIGDLAVVCGVAAGHRGAAFEASRALIDRLKATVPIWKEQHFADGGQEWVGAP